MPVLVLKKQGTADVKVISNCSITFLDMDADVAQHPPPSLQTLSELPRDLLVELCQMTNVEGSLKKVNRGDLAEHLVGEWADLTRVLARKALAMRAVPSPTPSVLSGDDEAPLLLGNPNDPHRIQVSLPLESQNLKFNFAFNTRTTGDDLLMALNAWFETMILPDNCILRVGESEVFHYETIHAYSGGNPVLYITPKLKGGMFKRSKGSFLTPEQAVDFLTKKSMSFIQTRIETPMELVGNATPEFEALIAPMKERLATLKQKMLTGEMSIKSMLEVESDEVLNRLEKIFDPKNKDNEGVPTEQKLFQTIEQLCPDVQAINSGIPHLHAVKMMIVEGMVKIYAQQFNGKHGGSPCYKNEVFLKMITDLKAYRQGLRAGSRADEPVVMGQEVRQASCQLM
eukprot:s1794_g12.t1